MGIFSFMSGLRGDHFDVAFSRVIKETTISASVAKSLSRHIRVAYEGGSARDAVKHVLALAPEDSWKWPAYEAQAPSIRRAEYEMRGKLIAEVDLDALLDMVPRKLLKEVHRELVPGKLPTRHAEITTAILSAVRPQSRALLKERLQADAREQLDEMFAAAPEAGLAAGSRSEAFVNRVLRLAHALSQRDRINESRKGFPSLMLDVPEPWRAKPECVAMDGKSRSIDNECWKTQFPPCERIDCLCSVIPVRKRGN